MKLRPSQSYAFASRNSRELTCIVPNCIVLNGRLRTSHGGTARLSPRTPVMVFGHAAPGTCRCPLPSLSLSPGFKNVHPESTLSRSLNTYPLRYHNPCGTLSRQHETLGLKAMRGLRRYHRMPLPRTPGTSARPARPFGSARLATGARRDVFAG